MEHYGREHAIVQLLARLELGTRDAVWIRGYLQRAAHEFNWERFVQRSMEERVPSLVLGRLAAFEREGNFSMPAHAIEPLWRVPGIRKLFFGPYQQASNTLTPAARLHHALVTYRHQVTRTLSKTLDVLHQSHIPALMIKGGALLSLYPPETRDLSDIDLIVPDQARGWQLIQQFKAHGFSVDTLDVGQGRDASVRIKVDLKSPDSVNVELHVGGFDLLGLGWLESPLWQRAQRMEVLAHQWSQTASPEDALLIIAAHMCREGVLCLRDINDTYLLLTQHAHELDWNYVAQTAQHNVLIEALQTLVRETQAIYGPLPLPSAWMTRWRGSQLMRWTLRSMVQKSRQGQHFWAVPYRTWYLIRFDRKRYGLAVALQHAVDSAMATFELDLGWMLQRIQPDAWITRGAVQVMRSAILQILLRNGWRLRRLPNWSYVRLHPVCPRHDGSVYDVIGVAPVDDEHAHLHLSKTAIDTLVWSASQEEVPDFLITPAGVYYSTRYTGRFTCSVSDLEALAGHIVNTLATQGAVLVKGASAPSSNEHTED